MLLIVVAMVIFGLIMVYSSSYIYSQERTGDGFAFIKKQVLFAVFGLAVMYGAFRLNYRIWMTWSYPILALGICALTLVFVPGLGVRSGGAERWISFGMVNIQPGEFAKFALVLFLAFQLDRKQAGLKAFRTGVGGTLLLSLPILGLLLAQPDFGTVVILTLVAFSLMFLAGVPGRHLTGIGGVVAVSGALLISASPYRLARLFSFLDPWQDPAGRGFQILQSFVGLHNGSFWGVGLGNGKSKLFYLPEAHNDFIFAVIGEELGFLGITAVVAIFSVFVYRGFRIGWECYKRYGDRFGFFLAVGLTLIIGIQSFVNMGVVMGLLPTKGLNLPFISYGGSSLLFNLFAVGVLLSVARGPDVQWNTDAGHKIEGV